MNAFAKAARERSAVYYSQHGFNALLNAALTHGNPHENYYFVVNAPSNDKTAVRPASEYTQYEKRGNIHPVVEFNKSAWNSMPGTWAQKGREFRQEMLKAGLPADTMWAINEAGSGIRAKSPLARRQMESLVSALSNDGVGKPRDRGLVFQQGPGTQPGNELKDNKFWSAMKQSVWRYMPEEYSAAKSFLNWDPQQRDQFLFRADKGRARGEFAPMMNSFWRATKGYGNTMVPLGDMRRFVAAQLAATRNQPVYGLAWNGIPAGMSPGRVAALANTIVQGG